VVRQSAKAQSDPGTLTTPDFTPAGVSDAADTRRALAVLRLAGFRPAAPGSDCVLTFPATATNRAHTGPVTDDPSRLRAMGTSMPSWAGVTAEIGRSPCHPLHTIV
jgi:hypothetical protein